MRITDLGQSDEAILKRMIVSGLGTGSAVDHVSITKDWENDSYVVKLDDGRIVCKIPLKDVAVRGIRNALEDALLACVCCSCGDMLIDGEFVECYSCIANRVADLRLMKADLRKSR